MLRLLGRIEKPECGRIFLDGRNISEYKRKEYAKKIAVMPQERDIPEISVYEFVANARYPYLDFSKRLSSEDKAAVRAALCSTETEKFSDRSIREVSGGERQRVYTAMLLAQETPCVLLDEPTTYLDIAHQFSVMKMLVKMKEEGKCVIVVLHDLALALKFSDKTLVMNDGEVYDFDTPENIVANGSVEKAFGVKCVRNGNDYMFYA